MKISVFDFGFRLKVHYILC